MQGFVYFEALEEVAQRNCGQSGLGLEKLVLGEGVPVHGRGLEPDDLEGLFQSKAFCDSFTDSFTFLLQQ